MKIVMMPNLFKNGEQAFYEPHSALTVLRPASHSFCSNSVEKDLKGNLTDIRFGRQTRVSRSAVVLSEQVKTEQN